MALSAILTRPLGIPVLLLALIETMSSGCVSKREADEQARTAFMAGQQQAYSRLMEGRGASVMILGQVRVPVIAWSPDLTISRALVEAGLVGNDPIAIHIIRNGRAIPVSPEKLLTGEDVTLERGDIVDVVPGPGLPVQRPPQAMPPSGLLRGQNNVETIGR